MADSALLLFSGLFIVGVLLAATFFKPSNTFIGSRAGFYIIVLLIGGGLTYIFNRKEDHDPDR